MRMNPRTIFLRYVIPVVIVMVGVATRFALPARSAVITPSAIDKLTVYSGVIMIVPNSTSALELGNAGRDIVSSKELYLRPSSSLQGTKFTLEPAVCAVDGKQCGDIDDCDDVTDPNTGSKQVCNNNFQDLTLTGNLTVQGNICLIYNSVKECLSSWPDDVSRYWALTDTTLNPMVPSELSIQPAVHIGDSRGYCEGATWIRCLSNDDCGLTPTHVCNISPTDGIRGTNAFSMYSTTYGAALNVTRGATFGDTMSEFFQKKGNTVVNGSVYVDGAVWMKVDSTLYKVWSAATPTDTQDGSGIDADTFNGTASLPFTVAGEQNDLRWWQYYKNPDGKTFPGAILTETGGGIVPLMCVHIAHEKVCVNGENAGQPCTDSSQCAGSICKKLCTPAQGQCSVDNLMYCEGTSPHIVCSTDADCGGVSCIEDSSMLKCSKPINGVYLPCIVDSDCPTAYEGNYCNPGKLFVADATCRISGNDCQTYCQGQKKCAGATTTGECTTFGQNIGYNTGTCVEKDEDRFCRCSLNVRDVSSLPYIDMTTYVSDVLEGEVCSLPFDVANQPHPVPNP